MPPLKSLEHLASVLSSTLKQERPLWQTLHFIELVRDEIHSELSYKPVEGQEVLNHTERLLSIISLRWQRVKELRGCFIKFLKVCSQWVQGETELQTVSEGLSEVEGKVRAAVKLALLGDSPVKKGKK